METGPFAREPEGDRFKREELTKVDTLIFGRLTYDAFAAVCPTVKDELGFAERMNSLPKYVASRTLKTASRNNTTLIGLKSRCRSKGAEDGRGKRLFPPDTRSTMKLAECKPFNDGIVLLRYVI